MKRGRRSTRRSASAKKTAAPVIAEPSLGANGDRDPLSDLLALLIAALLLARLLVPTEAAALGETLWIAQLWLAAALVWFWRQARNGAYRITGGWIDLAVWTLVAGHLVSGAIVLCTEGDKRAALNVMWEWVALGVMFFLVRTGASTRWARSSLTLAFCATAIALAGLGVWQYYVWYPQTASQYDAMRSELDTLLERAQTGRLTPDDADRLEQLQGEFMRQQIPLEGPERLLWEQRLKASREPFGLFALANTFAGLLLVWLLVLIDWAVTGSGQTRQNVSRCAGIALVAGCLLLTKSRTAWVGLLSGLLLWGGLKLRRYERPARIRSAKANESASGERPQEAFFRRWHLAALVVFLAAVVGAAVIASQGLDRLVITEAPKSLRYRFEYWQGTLRILKEHPWFGTGPGNFRQHYLRYKLAGSSEEIADPHNLFLDVWANAGVIGLVGLLGLLIGGGIRLFRSEPENETTASDDTSPPAFCRDLWLVGAAAGFLLVLGYEWLLDATADLRLPVLLIGAVFAAALIGRPTFTQCGWAAAMAGLGVHLLGAGGIEMPAIVQTLLVIVVLGTAPPLGGGRPASGSPAAARRSWPFWTATGLTAAAFLGCLLTATLPVLQRRALVSAADLAVVEGRGADRPLRLYQEAARVDPLSAVPYRRAAEFCFARWAAAAKSAEAKRQEDRLETLFRQAVQFMNEAIRRNPQEAESYATLADWYLAKFEHTKDSADAAVADSFLATACARYPSNVRYWARRAVAANLAGRRDDARRYAKEALRLDAINRHAGHVDKFLSQTVLGRLRELAE